MPDRGRRGIRHYMEIARALPPEVVERIDDPAIKEGVKLLRESEFNRITEFLEAMRERGHSVGINWFYRYFTKELEKTARIAGVLPAEEEKPEKEEPESVVQAVAEPQVITAEAKSRAKAGTGLSAIMADATAAAAIKPILERLARHEEALRRIGELTVYAVLATTFSPDELVRRAPELDDPRNLYLTVKERLEAIFAECSGRTAQLADELEALRDRLRRLEAENKLLRRLVADLYELYESAVSLLTWEQREKLLTGLVYARLLPRVVGRG